MSTSEYDIFISYRRNTGTAYSRTILQSLQPKGYRVFFDHENLHEGRFDEKIENAIRSCKDFLLILSKDSMNRCYEKDDWVAKEIHTALTAGCNIIPIIINDFEGFPSNFPAELKQVEYIQGVKYDDDYYQAFIQELEKRLSAEAEKKDIPSQPFEDEGLFLSDLDEIQIGDFYYSDGTFSHQLLNEKKCVGVVFDLETTTLEKQNGWTHGHIVAMEDAVASTKWCSKIGMSGTNFPTATNYEYFADGGYLLSIYPLGWSFYDFGELPELIAINKAKRFSQLPLPKPLTSGWYLPDALQMVQLLKNLGGAVLTNDSFDPNKVLARLKNYNLSFPSSFYWTSTLKNRAITFSKEMYAVRINMKEGVIDKGHENKGFCAIRTIATI